MSDVILYSKQKKSLAKAVSKAQAALADVTLVLASIGVTPADAADGAEDGAAEAAPKAKRGRPAKEKPAKPAKNGGSAFAEM